MSDSGSISFSVSPPPPRVVEQPPADPTHAPTNNGVDQAKEVLRQEAPAAPSVEEPNEAAAPAVAEAERVPTPPPALADEVERVPSPDGNVIEGAANNAAVPQDAREASPLPAGAGSPSDEIKHDEAPSVSDADEAPAAAPEAAQGEDNGSKRKADGDDADEPEAKRANIDGAEQE